MRVPYRPFQQVQSQALFSKESLRLLPSESALKQCICAIDTGIGLAKE